MKAVFLDRDGVINRYPGDAKYVTKWEEFRFLPNTKKAIALLNKNKYKIFVISNQAGVGKEIYSQKALDTITKRMLIELKEFPATIDRVCYCTHREEDGCSCRKPKAGLIYLATKATSISIKDSFLIGDTIRDVLTARTAGCKSILVFSGKEKPDNSAQWEMQPDYVFANLYAAAKFIVSAD